MNCLHCLAPLAYTAYTVFIAYTVYIAKYVVRALGEYGSKDAKKWSG